MMNILYYGTLDCLVYEMLFIRKKKPSLNTQSDSIGAKLFLQKLLFRHPPRNVISHFSSYTLDR